MVYFVMLRGCRVAFKCPKITRFARKVAHPKPMLPGRYTTFQALLSSSIHSDVALNYSFYKQLFSYRLAVVSIFLIFSCGATQYMVLCVCECV